MDNIPIEKFLISELAERAGTTIRTIRYYTDEGLLPQPETQGKYAYYNENHLNRLELIRRMKTAYLPLREIQQVMLSLTDDEVQKRLVEGLSSDHKTRPEAPSPAASGSGSNALNYISLLLKDQQVPRPQEAPEVVRAPAPSILEQSSRYISPNPQPEAIASEIWQRISLAPGLELHIRNPVKPEIASRIQQLTAFANKLFRQT